MAEKARLEALARTGAWGPGVADGPTLHPGETDPRVAGCAARLARLGYVAPDAEVGRRRLRPRRWSRRCRAFQRDHGLNDDGVVGAQTLAAINAPVETRLAQVVVNLERLRWMNRRPRARATSCVNIPDFTVTLVEDGAAGLAARRSWSARRTRPARRSSPT